MCNTFLTFKTTALRNGDYRPGESRSGGFLGARKKTAKSERICGRKPNRHVVFKPLRPSCYQSLLQPQGAQSLPGDGSETEPRASCSWVCWAARRRSLRVASSIARASTRCLRSIGSAAMTSSSFLATVLENGFKSAPTAANKSRQ